MGKRRASNKICGQQTKRIQTRGHFKKFMGKLHMNFEKVCPTMNLILIAFLCDVLEIPSNTGKELKMDVVLDKA